MMGRRRDVTLSCGSLGWWLCCRSGRIVIVTKVRRVEAGEAEYTRVVAVEM
jgi:hypothetical protein